MVLIDDIYIVDRVNQNKFSLRSLERLQPRWSNEQGQLLRKLDAVIDNPETFVRRALDELQRELIQFNFSQKEFRTTCIHLVRYAKMCREYIQVRGMPNAIRDFQDQLENWKSRLTRMAEEMEQSGLTKEAATLNDLAVQVWSKQLRQTPGRKIPGDELMNLSHVQGHERLVRMSRLFKKYRKAREKSDEDHFISNFVVPLDRLLPKRRGKFLFISSIFLDFYPSYNQTDGHTKQKLETVSNLLMERLKTHQKQYLAPKPGW